MKLPGTLVLLWVALLLPYHGNCDICPPVKNDVNLFLTGTPDEYVNNVAKYQDNPLILTNARNLKTCADAKLTEEDKQHALTVLDKIYSNPRC
ncbi:major allergen I polypeptide chain 1-like [Dasypus novemcinctus]|uniref:major allergen I polypeptide chain 1-like n=1 Tax=Dasypus novemcinctus TaxID=9361 RepID=UPI000328AA52